MELEVANVSVLEDYKRNKPDAHLQAWAEENEPRDTMIYKKGYWDQIILIRDEVSNFFFRELVAIEVISTHTSKSIKLPVYRVLLKSGMEMIMRYNFHDWKVSVSSPKDLTFPIELFNKGGKEQITHHYCEGFKDEWIYESYNKNKEKFTVELPSGEHYIWTFFFLLKLELLK